jgi:dipeptidyl-peptidase-4
VEEAEDLDWGVCRFVLLLAVASLLAGADKKPVTIDAILNQHRAAMPNPIWAPDGSHFAVVHQDKVKLYNAASGDSKDFFDLAPLRREARHPDSAQAFNWQNRRVTSNSFQWASDSKEMLAAVDGDLFLIHGNGKSTQLTQTDAEEEDPKLSPDGKQVLYRSASNLYLLNVETKHVTPLTTDGSATLLNGQLDWVYPEELDLSTASWWSPDSRRIAFMQFDVGKEFVYPQTDLLGERAELEPQRYPQAGTPNAQVRIGVIDVETQAIHWMDLGSTDYSLLARVIWLPDSRTLSVERLSRLQDKLELLFCDAASGKARRVLQEESKTWINFTDNFYPLQANGEFLWTSEMSGFRHIYRYSAKGELLDQITSGDWEVRGISAIDEGKQLIYFASSEVSPLETQLYAVSFQGGARRRITMEEGSHNIEANGDGTAFVDSFSSFRQPPQAILKNAAGEKIKVLVAPDKSSTEEYLILPSEIVQVKANDGTTLYGRLTKPANYQPGTKYPLIVEVYGGPGVQLIRNQWSGVSWGQMMAQKGYVVFSLDNRGSSGRGHAFEEPIFHDMGTTEVADQKAGVEFLIQKGLVDPNRVGITGWSYGGFMTIHALLFAPDVFKVGVAGAPVTDWHNYDTIYTERYMGLPEKNRARYDATSNVKNAEQLRGKLLIVHNAEDDNVLFQNTMQMANALEQADKQFFMQIYPQKTHGVSGGLRRPLEEATTDFFDRNLNSVQVLH